MEKKVLVCPSLLGFFLFQSHFSGVLCTFGFFLKHSMQLIDSGWFIKPAWVGLYPVLEAMVLAVSKDTENHAVGEVEARCSLLPSVGTGWLHGLVTKGCN